MPKPFKGVSRRALEPWRCAEGASFVQENIVERAEPKQRLFAEVERLAPRDAILSSSTSAIMPSIIFGGLATRDRCLVSHPDEPAASCTYRGNLRRRLHFAGSNRQDAGLHGGL